jgi:TRAP-type C4-dicarboxylate transport system substrate-binding protein
MLLYIDSAYDLGVHKTARNVLLSQNLWLSHLYIVAMNKKVYDALEKKDKDAIKRAAVLAYRVQGKNMDANFTRLIDKFKAEGASVSLMNNRELSKWAHLSNYKKAQSDWIEESDDASKNTKRRVLENVDILIDEFTKFSISKTRCIF